jgi:hypothetical protein
MARRSPTSPRSGHAFRPDRRHRPGPAPVAAGIPPPGTRRHSQKRAWRSTQARLLAGERRAVRLCHHRGAGGGRRRPGRLSSPGHARLLGRRKEHRRGRDDPRLPVGGGLRSGAGRQGAAHGGGNLCPKHSRGGHGGRLRLALLRREHGQKFWGQDRLEDLDLHARLDHFTRVPVPGTGRSPRRLPTSR